MFDVGAKATAVADRKDWQLSGFSINGNLNEPDKSDEITVFQGASYFRALSKGQIYGTSARGLAIGTGRPSPDEFPIFKTFWVERPDREARDIVIYALMDSPSITSAYRFEIAPGNPTRVRVEAILHPRVQLTEIGFAPLTSMHLFSPMQPARVSDFRPRVHDSDGLAILRSPICSHGQTMRLLAPAAGWKDHLSAKIMKKVAVRTCTGLPSTTEVRNLDEDLSRRYRKCPQPVAR